MCSWVLGIHCLIEIKVSLSVDEYPSIFPQISPSKFQKSVSMYRYMERMYRYITENLSGRFYPKLYRYMFSEYRYIHSGPQCIDTCKACTDTLKCKYHPRIFNRIMYRCWLWKLVSCTDTWVACTDTCLSESYKMKGKWSKCLNNHLKWFLK